MHSDIGAGIIHVSSNQLDDSWKFGLNLFFAKLDLYTSELTPGQRKKITLENIFAKS